MTRTRDQCRATGIASPADDPVEPLPPPRAARPSRARRASRSHGASSSRSSQRRRGVAYVLPRDKRERRSVEWLGAGVRLKLPSSCDAWPPGGRRSLISACETPPPRPFCKPLGPPAPLVAIPLEVVQGPTQLVVAGPDFAEEPLNG